MLRLSLILMLLFASPVWADDGNFLYESCTDDTNEGRSYCVGYSSAILDLMGSGNVLYGWKACISGNVTKDRIYDIVTQHLALNPQDIHNGAESLVAWGLSEAFPC